MLLATIRFYCANFVRFFLPQQREIPVCKGTESHNRRYTVQYRQKRGRVRSLWIAVSLVMLCFPLLPLLLGLGFFSAFLSFAILDETV
ncbi:hypothetical protein [Microbulbifer sp. 2205BS26-8]|uniref:hypothetical protein n=1 Tax=Microbulbifer sp. 2205BS26-8 TaxID=3064386 RepID=UPI00273FACA6|nr:hypothetical protein [Microbulbifer sp. 2205BS26-8]MDP5208303.1 hypothetical protein [Microbulbifer sp. 2205BS26-8]